MQSIVDTKRDVAIISDPYRDYKSDKWVADKGNLAVIYACGRHTIEEAWNDQEGFVIARVNSIYFCSCYAPPRWTLQEYEAMLDTLTRLLIGKKPVVIAGDFNAWAIEWGSKSTNPRGYSTLEALAKLDVCIANVGNQSTFQRNGYESVIDVTFCSPTIVNDMDWRVGDEYIASDHHPIWYTVGRKSQREDRMHSSGIRWKLQKLDAKLLCEAFGLITDSKRELKPKELTNAVKSVCDVAMPRKVEHKFHRKPVYWWNSDIAAIRANCLSTRRKMQRARTEDARASRMEAYRAAKLKLKLAIRDSKRDKFKELCEQINANPWGDAYRIAMARLKGPAKQRETCPVKLKEIVATLFPTHSETRWDHSSPVSECTEDKITNSELIDAVKELNLGKAPGPDGIPNEVLRHLVQKYPDVFRNTYQRCMDECKFPDQWKRQRLVLLPKQGKVGDPVSYRPICLLDTHGKLLEKVILNRLTKYAEGDNGLSDNQLGFRKKRCTLDAIQMVIDKAEIALNSHHRVNRYCAIATVDVKNAFNSACWKTISRSLQDIGVSEQLRRIIESYLSNRTLEYDTKNGIVRTEVTAGVPQGSIIGPTLWNIMYDGVLRLNLPSGVEIVGFADDILLMSLGDTEAETSVKMKDAIEIVQEWLGGRKLSVAHHKTEMVIVTNRRQPVTTQVEIEQSMISSKRHIKYLGVMLDDRLNFTSHVDYITKKAAKVQTTLARIMPNKAGATSSKRRMLANVVSSTVRYGAPIWRKALESKSNAEKLNRVHRLSAIRVIGAYRSISFDAACVIAGMVPICSLIEEDSKCWSSKKKQGDPERVKHREQTISEWQKSWEKSIKGRWTYKLIPSIKSWIDRPHGEVDYYLTQFLSGHGGFEEYLHRIGKADSPYCPECRIAEETPEHVFFECTRFDLERDEMAKLTKPGIDVRNIVDIMCEKQQYWTAVQQMVTKVIIRLESERCRQ